MLVWFTYGYNLLLKCSQQSIVGNKNNSYYNFEAKIVKLF